MKNKLIFYILVFVFMVSTLHFDPVNATSLQESDVIASLQDHPETLILDIRWQQIYEEYHLKGALLIDNSNPYPGKDHAEAAQYALNLVLQQSNFDKSSPILVVCNCPASEEPEVTPGSNTYASYADTYLTDAGYTNVHHLYGSFSDWKDTSWLVAGSTPNGTSPVTSIPPLTGGGGGDPTFMFIVIGGVGIGGLGFILYAMRPPPNTKGLKKSLEKTQLKQKQELSKLKDALGTDTVKETTSGKKKSVRRRK